MSTDLFQWPRHDDQVHAVTRDGHVQTHLSDSVGNRHKQCAVVLSFCLVVVVRVVSLRIVFGVQIVRTNVMI